MGDDETKVTIEHESDLTPAQQIRLDALGYLIQLEGAPVFKSIPEWKEMCSDTSKWVETGEWPPRAPSKPTLKAIRGGQSDSA